MNRAIYFNSIERELTSLCVSIKLRGKLNLLEYNIHAEDFFASFLNALFGWNLINLNSTDQNSDAIDLYDEQNNLYIQVSAKSNKEKVQGTLNSKFFDSHAGCQFMFISVTIDGAGKLKKKNFSIPAGIKFDPCKDIIDIECLLRAVQHSTSKCQQLLYDLTNSELGRVVDPVRLNSNLSLIIEVLSHENLSNSGSLKIEKSFEIDAKIDFNELTNIRPLIEENMVHCSKVSSKYCELDKIGSNKSTTVLNIIRKHYLEATSEHRYKCPDELFFGIIRELKEDVLKSGNCPDIPIEELELCLSIVVIDAFIRCKIFENPEGYHYVAAG